MDIMVESWWNILKILVRANSSSVRYPAFPSSPISVLRRCTDTVRNKIGNIGKQGCHHLPIEVPLIVIDGEGLDCLHDGSG